MSSEKDSIQSSAPLIYNRSLPKPVALLLGESSSITVDITGVPAPVVRWRIGRRRVRQSTRYQTKTDGRLGHTLVIASVTEELERGVWVVASNEHGEDRCHIEVAINPVPISGDRLPSVDDVTSASGDAGMTTHPVLRHSLDSGVVRNDRRKKSSEAEPTRFNSTEAIYSGIRNSRQPSLRDSKDIPDVVGEPGTTQSTEATRRKKNLRKKASATHSSLNSAGGKHPNETELKEVVNEANVASEPPGKTEAVKDKDGKKRGVGDIPKTAFAVDENLSAEQEGRVMWELFGIKLDLLCRQLLLRGFEFNGDLGTREDFGGTFQKTNVHTVDSFVPAVDSWKQAIDDKEYINPLVKHCQDPATRDLHADLEEDVEKEERKESSKLCDRPSGSPVNVVERTLSNDENRQVVEKDSSEDETDGIEVNSNNHQRVKETVMPATETVKTSTDSAAIIMPNDRSKVMDKMLTSETNAAAKVTGAKSEVSKTEIDGNYIYSEHGKSQPDSVEEKFSPEKKFAVHANKLADKPPTGKRKQLVFSDEKQDGIRQKRSEVHQNILEKSPTSTDAAEQIYKSNNASDSGKIMKEQDELNKAVTRPSIVSGHSHLQQSRGKSNRNIATPGMIASLPNLLAPNRPVDTKGPKDPKREPNDSHVVMADTAEKIDSSVNLKLTNSAANEAKATQLDHVVDAKNSTNPEKATVSTPSVSLTTYITHKSRKLQTDIGDTPSAPVAINNGGENSTAPADTTTTPASKIPPPDGIAWKHPSGSLPPTPGSSDRPGEVSESNIRENVDADKAQVRSRSAERPTPVPIYAETGAKQREYQGVGDEFSPKTRTGHRSLGTSNLHRSQSGELENRGEIQPDANDDSYESSQRPKTRHRLTLEPARSEEFLSQKSDPISKVNPLQRGSRSVESLGGSNDSFGSRIGRRRLSKEWQIVTVTTTEEILVIDQSKTKAHTANKSDEEKDDSEKDIQAFKQSVTDGEEANERSIETAQGEREQTPKLTVKELRAKFLGLGEENNTQRNHPKLDTPKIHSKTMTQDPTMKFEKENDEHLDISRRELLNDAQKNITGFSIRDETLKDGSKVDSTNIEPQNNTHESNIGLQRQKDEKQPSQETENVTYISNATILLKSPTIPKAETGKSSRRLDVGTSRNRLSSQDNYTQTDSADLSKEMDTTTCTAVQANDDETKDKNSNIMGIEKVSPAVFYEYGEMLSYHLDKGDEDHVEIQDPEMELIRLQLKEPTTATVNETFERIILTPQTRQSEEKISGNDTSSDHLDQATDQNSSSTFTGEKEIKSLKNSPARERSMTEQISQDNEFQPITDPNVTASQNEAAVRKISNRIQEDENSIDIKVTENRSTQEDADDDDIVTNADRHQNESSVENNESKKRDHINEQMKPAEEMADVTGSDATLRDDSSDEESVPSCATVILKAETEKPTLANTAEVTKGNNSDKSFDTKMAYNMQTNRRADDTDDDEFLELELDMSRTDATDNASKLQTVHDGVEGVHHDEDDTWLGAVGGDIPLRLHTNVEQDDGARHSEDRGSHQPDHSRTERTYEELEDKTFMHSALSRLGTVLFLLLAAVIFHFLNHIVGDELE